MKLNYNVTGTERKKLVGAISQELNSPMKYLGMPTAAYEIADPNGMGTYTISKTGEVEGPYNIGLAETLNALGFAAVSEDYGVDGVEAQEAGEVVETGGETETETDTETTETLAAEAEAYAEREMRRMRLENENVPDYSNREQYGGDCISDYEDGEDEDEMPESEDYCWLEPDGDVSETPETAAADAPDTLIIEVPAMAPEKMENLCRMVEAKAPLIMAALGAEDLPIQLDGDKLKFPWFSGNLDHEHVEAYSTFVSQLCKTAKKKQRVTAKEKPIDGSPKYAMRCFLLSLGFIGSEYKTSRKVLLSKLEGNGAWKNVKGAEGDDGQE